MMCVLTDQFITITETETPTHTPTHTGHVV